MEPDCRKKRLFDMYFLSFVQRLSVVKNNLPLQTLSNYKIYSPLVVT